MTDDTSFERSDDLKDQALAWLVRVQSDCASAEDWAALTDWLERSPAHLAAFEWAERLDSELQQLAPELLGDRGPVSAEVIPFAPVALRARSARRGSARPKGAGRWSRFAAAGLAIALVAAAGVLVSTPRRADFATGAEQTRTVRLADGTAIALNANSRIETRLGLLSRDVRLVSGEASFDVAHEAARPFHVDFARHRVTVLGTEFNINRMGDTTVVTVLRGVVRVSRLADGEGPSQLSLAKGDQAVLTGAGAAVVTRHVTADDAFAWREGRLVCADMPVSQIIAYANRSYREPITISAMAGQRRFSGVLMVKDEALFVHNLALYLSLSETHLNGRYTLR